MTGFRYANPLGTLEVAATQNAAYPSHKVIIRIMGNLRTFLMLVPMRQNPLEVFSTTLYHTTQLTLNVALAEMVRIRVGGSRAVFDQRYLAHVLMARKARQILTEASRQPDWPWHG